MKQLSQKKAYIILMLLILSALMLYTYFFFAKKKGYDSDEVWSYALSNSYYRPFLETTAGWNMAYTKEDTHYIAEWFNGSVYHDYITVQKGQQFSYDSVWYNQANDVHPPLYYAIIHTICSFFPDIYSPWFALSVNYAAFILVMLLLFRFCQKWGSPTFALISCALYAFSGGATDTYTFLRMYGLCALWATLLFYLLYDYLSKPSRKILTLLSLVTVCASLTHYYLILFAFFLTLVTEIYLLVKKQWKTFFLLGLTMLFSVLLAFCIFPPAITHLFFRGGDFSAQKMSLYCQIKYIISLISWQFTGISISIYHTMFPLYAATGLAILSAILLLSFILFRREKLAAHFFHKAKELGLIIYHCLQKTVKSLPFLYGIPVATMLCLYVFFVFNLPLATMKENSIRYLCPFYPLLLWVVMVFLRTLIKTIYPKAHYIFVTSVLLLIVFTCSSNLFTSHPLLYDSIDTYGAKIDDLEADAYYIVLLEEPSRFSNFSMDLQTKNTIYTVCQKGFYTSELPASLSQLPSDTEAPVYLLYSAAENDNVIVKGTKSKAEWLEMIGKLPYVTACIQIGTDCTNGYPIEIYRLR